MTTTRFATHSLLSRRTTMTRLLAGGLLLGTSAWLAAPPASAQTVNSGQLAQVSPTARLAGKAPPSMKLDYALKGRVSRIGYSANATLDWRLSGNSYTLDFTARAPLVSRTQSSSGTVGANGLRPSRFTDKWRGKTNSASFQHSGSQGSISYSNGNSAAALLPGAQDQISVFIQLMALMDANPGKYGTGQIFAFQASDHRRAPVWRFRVQGKETIEAAGQSFEAWRVRRVLEDGEDKLVEIWLSPWKAANGSTYHLPVRLRISEGPNDYAEQTLKALPKL